MITKRFQKGDAASEAVYSDCKRYRFTLTRVWDETGGAVHFVMLNPSTATEEQNDPTVERCERRARTLGFGRFRVTNIFAWRDTDPMGLRRSQEPVGEGNDAAIQEGLAWADQTIAAWGTHGALLDRGATVRAILSASKRTIHVLGLTKAGHPKHPLYLPYAQTPFLWDI